jgi:predicted HNH restriction endonuclease
MTTYDLESIPSAVAYRDGLLAISTKVTPTHRRIFQAQYHSPKHTATATQIATLAGIKGGHMVVNVLYGKLGHHFCDVTGFKPELRPGDTARWWAVWSTGISTATQGFLWALRPQVCQALIDLGWIQEAPVLEDAFRENDEELLSRARQLTEAERQQRLRFSPKKAASVQVLRMEFQRNPNVVASTLYRAKGFCELCQQPAPFERESDGTPYLEVHHIVSLADGGDDTLENTLALCPNCHRELHFGNDKKRHNQSAQATR